MFDVLIETLDPFRTGVSAPNNTVQDNVSVDDKMRLLDSVDESSWFIISSLQPSDP